MEDVTKQLHSQRGQVLDRRKEFEMGSLSTVLRIALEDLEATERLSGVYLIDMEIYHSPDAVSGRCVVCHAGAVMAHTLGARPTSPLRPCDYPPPISNRLEAIDWARMGAFSFAAEAMGYSEEMQFEIYRLTGEDDDVTPYDVHTSKFKADMRKAIDILATSGY
jgi:hypothetical protein